MIYAIQCRTTGRIYIGRTGNPPEKRFREHMAALSRSMHSSKEMQEDFDKYGAENFDLYQIETGGTRRDEAYWQLFFRTNDPQYGYNSQDIHNRPRELQSFKRYKDPLKGWHGAEQEIAKRLRRLRGTRSMQEVADGTGLTRAAICNYEKGLRVPSDEHKAALAAYFKTSVDDLFYKEVSTT